MSSKKKFISIKNTAYQNRLPFNDLNCILGWQKFCWPTAAIDWHVSADQSYIKVIYINIYKI